MKKAPLRRMIVFMTGYDKAGPDRIHLMLRQQSRYYTKRFGIPLKLGEFVRNELPSSYFSKIEIEAQWPEGNCHIDYFISDWQDSVLAMEALPFWRRSASYLHGYISSWLNGAFLKIAKWQAYFLIVFSVPLFCLLARLLIVILGFYLVSFLFKTLDLPNLVGGIIGLGIGALSAYKLQPFFDSLYEGQIAGPVIFQTALSINGDEEQKERSRVFSDEIIKEFDASKPDEIIIISHSCGCFHSLPLHKALLQHRSQSSHKPEIIQFSVGSLFPFTLAYPPEKTYNNIFKELLLNEECRWIDYFAPQDPFSVPFADAKTDFDLLKDQRAKAQHEVRSAKFFEIFDEKKMRIFKYNPLRMHFQYMAANDTPGDYDFFRIISHPLSVKNNLNPIEGEGVINCPSHN